MAEKHDLAYGNFDDWTNVKKTCCFCSFPAVPNIKCSSFVFCFPRNFEIHCTDLKCANAQECCITIFDILGLGLLYTGTRRSFPILNKTKYADYRSNMGLSLWVKHGQIGNHHINPKKALPCTWLFARCTSVCCPFRLSLCLAFGFRRPLSRLLLTGHSGPAKRGHGYTQVMQGQMPTKCF